jgi:hypothetical protein
MKATTKQAKEVQVIARYAHKTNGKLNGNVSYLVRNGGGKEYCITLASNGNTACNHHEPAKKLDIPESCESSKGGRKCYHIKACQKQEEVRGWQIPEGKSLVRDDYRPEESEAEHDDLVEAPNGLVMTPEELANVPCATPELEDEEQRVSRWTALELAALRKGPVPAGKAPTPRKVSMEWLCGRR